MLLHTKALSQLFGVLTHCRTKQQSNGTVLTVVHLTHPKKKRKLTCAVKTKVKTSDPSDGTPSVVEPKPGTLTQTKHKHRDTGLELSAHTQKYSNQRQIF